MANPKYSTVLRNPYTGEEVIISASKEDVFVRKQDEQLAKWDRENHIIEMKQEAERRTGELKTVYDSLLALCYINVFPISPEIYLDEKLSNVRKRFRYRPTIEDAEKDVGITKLVKATGILPGKPKKKLEGLRQKANELLKTRMNDYNQGVKDDEDDFSNRREKERDRLLKQLKAVSIGMEDSTCKYFTYALNRDDFSVDNQNRFLPEFRVYSYSREKEEICFEYRIPNGEEIPSVAKYEYDIKTDCIKTCHYDNKTAAKWRTRIAESVLLRAVAVVFRSDYYQKVKNITVNGYLRYYDPAFGNDQKKTVIRAKITRDLFNKVSLERVNPEDLFSRELKATISSGLYAKEPYSLSEIE